MQKCAFHWEVVDVLSSCVCVCKTIFVWKRQSLGHARCCNPLGDLQSLLAMWMCVCENVSPEPCLCLMVVLSTRWPSEPDGVWLHACESVCPTSAPPGTPVSPHTHHSSNAAHPTSRPPSSFQLGVITSKQKREDYRFVPQRKLASL